MTHRLWKDLITMLWLMTAMTRRSTPEFFVCGKQKHWGLELYITSNSVRSQVLDLWLLLLLTPANFCHVLRRHFSFSRPRKGNSIRAGDTVWLTGWTRVIFFSKRMMLWNKRKILLKLCGVFLYICVLFSLLPGGKPGYISCIREDVLFSQKMEIKGNTLGCLLHFLKL